MIRLELYTDPDARRDPDATVEGEAYDFARMSTRTIVERTADAFADALDGERPYLLVLDDGRVSPHTHRWHPTTRPADDTDTALENELRFVLEDVVTTWRSSDVATDDYVVGGDTTERVSGGDSR